jgi:CRP-like cAMP-binding protein
MSSILDAVQDRELRRFAAGEVVLTQGSRTGLLLFLVEGSVEVLKDEVPVARVAEPGAIFGDLAALLGGDHTATVRALEPSAFRIVEDPRAFLHASPLVCLQLCELLARRLDALNHYLVDVKQQFEGDDHLGMLDGVLHTLLHRQPRPRVRPPDSTIRHGQSPD